MSAVLVLVAHGSRDGAAGECVEALATGVRAALPGVAVRVGYVDVAAPSVAAAVTDLPAAVVVPAFLASGYHVRTDLPAQLTAAGGPTVHGRRTGARRTGRGPLLARVPGPGAGGADRWTVTSALGPDPLLAAAALDRLDEAGRRPGDAVVLAAAGSSDPVALGDVREAARLLGAAAGRRIRVGFAATGAPRVDALVAGLRAAGERRVAVASWLLAPGAFQARLAAAGADVVAAPLGAHPAVVAAVVARYRAAVARAAA